MLNLCKHITWAATEGLWCAERRRATLTPEWCKVVALRRWEELNPDSL